MYDQCCNSLLIASLLWCSVWPKGKWDVKRLAYSLLFFTGIPHGSHTWWFYFAFFLISSNWIKARIWTGAVRPQFLISCMGKMRCPVYLNCHWCYVNILSFELECCWENSPSLYHHNYILGKEGMWTAIKPIISYCICSKVWWGKICHGWFYYSVKYLEHKWRCACFFSICFHYHFGVAKFPKTFIYMFCIGKNPKLTSLPMENSD